MDAFFSSQPPMGAFSYNGNCSFHVPFNHVKPNLNRVSVDHVSFRQTPRYTPPQWRSRQSSPTRSLSPPRRSPSPPRQLTPVSESTAAIGSIVFVPPKSMFNRDLKIVSCAGGYGGGYDYSKDKHLHEHGFNHPAVILDLYCDDESGEVMTLCCTISANPEANGMEERLSLPISQRPLTMGPPDPTCDKTMYLEKDYMRKKCYILTHFVYAIPLNHLCSFSDKPFQHRLSQESWEILMKKVHPRIRLWLPEGMDEEPITYIPTEDLEAGDLDPNLARSSPFPDM